MKSNSGRNIPLINVSSAEETQWDIHLNYVKTAEEISDLQLYSSVLSEVKENETYRL